ncbi:MAG: NADP-dependent oxidoreductase [Myxococcota bacterium]|nr:NADP-dependent oxidoreductase [Myxococcota bacterium]
MTATMRGLVLDSSRGWAPTLRTDLARPTTGPGEVLVRVTHAGVFGHDFELAKRWLGRLLGRVQGARGEVRTGLDFAGVVQTGGERFREGARVMGYVDMVSGYKPHADYLAIPEAYLTHAPEGVDPAHAAALPMSAQTALVALREIAAVGPGQRVLVLGASGGVGVMAVQIARLLGAGVTAVASPPHHALLTELGAEECVDYRTTRLEAMQGPYDAVLDFSATARLSQVRHLLGPAGVFIPADPMRNLSDIVCSRRAKWLMVDRGDAALLDQIAAWAARGELRPIVSEVFDLSEWPRAVARSHERGTAGRLVLRLGEG